MNPKHKEQITAKHGHPAADALDWDEAMGLIGSLIEDEYYRDAMLVACGCFLGLRISDILPLRWKDILSEDGRLTVKETKTGKMRVMQVNPKLRSITCTCHDALHVTYESSYIFSGQVYGANRPITRYRAAQILNEAKTRYGIKSATVFSTHSLRKTFGRRVWLQQCEQGRGDQALQLLSEIFGHAHVHITKRYLGIRQDELMSVYSLLD